VKDISQVVELDTIDTKTKVGLPNATKLGCPFRIVRTIRSRRKFFPACLASCDSADVERRRRPGRSTGNW